MRHIQFGIFILLLISLPFYGANSFSLKKSLIGTVSIEGKVHNGKYLYVTAGSSLYSIGNQAGGFPSVGFHARALLPVENPKAQLALYEKILSEGLSVRSVEELVRNEAEAPTKGNEEKGNSVVHKSKMPSEFNLLKDRLSDFFKADVQLSCNDKGKGKITIPFTTEDELERLIALFDKLR